MVPQEGVRHKLVVFPDHLRIKFLAFRSRVLRPHDLLDLSTRRGHQIWLRKDLFRCVPLAWGLMGPGIYLRPHKGRAYFFRTRDTEELIGVLGGWRGVSVSSTRRKKEASPVARDRFGEDQETTDWITSIAPDLLKDDG